MFLSVGCGKSTLSFDVDPVTEVEIWRVLSGLLDDILDLLFFVDDRDTTLP